MYCFSGTPKIFSRPQAPFCFLHHALSRLTHPMQVGQARSHASTRARHRLHTAHSVRRLPPQDRALRLHRDAPPRRQDGDLHPRLAARGDRVPAHSPALRISLALPQAIEGGGVGLSARGHGAAARDRNERARNRVARRLPQRRAGAALWRRQSRRVARHLPRRHRARRIRRHGPARVVGDHPAGVGGSAGLGGLHRHAQGAQRLLRAVAALAVGTALVFP